jgi:caspase domain-containing protein
MTACSRRYIQRSLLTACLVVGSSGLAYAQTHRALLIGISHYAPPPGATVGALAAGARGRDSRFDPGASWINLHAPASDVASMKLLLSQTFGFTDVRVLEEPQETRKGILAAIDQLVADTRPGDIDVIYYSGHGSRRVDTLSSSKNHFDETIVPIDAWKGIEDIRDKELAQRFNRIVYDRQAHLTAIFDSCNSGTMARGVTATVARSLPYDDRDVAQEKRTDPATVVESDLKNIPQHGDAIIVAAARPDESAVEALYPDDHQWHGAFTRALVRVLQASTQTLSADDVVAAAAAMMHADPAPFQQPSVEGRSQQSLFGTPLATHALHALVTKLSGASLTLDLGSAAGFDVGTQFRAVSSAPEGTRTVLQVQRVDEPLVSTATVVSGSRSVSVGQTFEIIEMTYPRAARLSIFASIPETDPRGATEQAKAAFPSLAWIADPTTKAIDFLVVQEASGWIAYSKDGHPAGPGAAPRGAGFLLMGPTPSLQAAIKQSAPFQRGAFTFAQKPSEANYLLAARKRSDDRREYAFIDPIVLGAYSPAWVRSSEDDADDTALNDGKPPEVVCRHDVSFPVRTGWLPEDRSASNNSLVLALVTRIVRLGKLRIWLQTPALAPGVEGWPYQLKISEPGSDSPIQGMLHLDQPYGVNFVTTAERRARVPPIPRYVYLIGFDCAANPFLLYPPAELNGDAPVPQPGANGVFPLSVTLGVQEAVGTPLGADTLFLLLTAQKLTTPGLLIADGLVGAAKGSANRFDELVDDLTDASTKGPRAVPKNWLVQQLVIPSGR